MNEVIKNLINAIKEDKPLDVKKEFSSLANGKIAKMIEEKRRQIATKLFSPTK